MLLFPGVGGINTSSWNPPRDARLMPQRVGSVRVRPGTRGKRLSFSCSEQRKHHPGLTNGPGRLAFVLSGDGLLTPEAGPVRVSLRTPGNPLEVSVGCGLRAVAKPYLPIGASSWVTLTVHVTCGLSRVHDRGEAIAPTAASCSASPASASALPIHASRVRGCANSIRLESGIWKR